MNYQNKVKNQEERMGAGDVALLLSQTMKDVTARKITLRYAVVISRLATALSKTIETADINDRVAFLEQVLKKKK